MLDGHSLDGAAAEAAALLARVAGQDVAEGDNGVFRIVRGTAADRVISTVEPEARHGHRAATDTSTATRPTSASIPTPRSFAAATVIPANTADRDAVDELLEEPGWAIA